jgi:hypothetical protein
MSRTKGKMPVSRAIVRPRSRLVVSRATGELGRGERCAGRRGEGRSGGGAVRGIGGAVRGTGGAVRGIGGAGRGGGGGGRSMGGAGRDLEVEVSISYPGSAQERRATRVVNMVAARLLCVANRQERNPKSNGRAPLVETLEPPCARQPAPVRRPDGTHRWLFTVAAFRPWRGSQARAASDPAFNAT